MKKFVSTNVLEKASTPYKLIKVDLFEKDVYLPNKLLDPRTTTKQKLEAVGASTDKKNQTSKGLFKYIKSHCGKDIRKMSSQISCGEKC